MSNPEPLDLRHLVGGIRAADISTVGLAIAYGGCPHTEAEPVESGGEIVAWLCVDPECGAQLPAEWR